VKPEIERVIQLIQRKDQKSLDEALTLLQNTVFSFSMKACGQRQDAEDTMQEVLLKSVPFLPNFDSPKALTVWLYKVAKNQCLMNRRRSKFAPKEGLSLEELMPDRKELETLSNQTDGTAETSLLRDENARHIRKALQKLPTDYRLILVLHDMEDLSDEEIADITGLRLGTIRVRLHRARLFMRKELAKQNRPRIQSHIPAPVTTVRTGPGQRQCKELFGELSNYLDDRLDDSLCEELEKHMDGCEPCKAFLSNLKKSIDLCKTSASGAPDPVAAARLRRELLLKYQSVMTKVARGRETSVD
jgi:RNA polymerase sigma-70 factor, ECF subfamily